MGIFDINMPLLYEEGKKAFFRLQERILNAGDDSSIFACKASKHSNGPFGCLADSPLGFANAAGIVLLESSAANYMHWLIKGLR